MLNKQEISELKTRCLAIKRTGYTLAGAERYIKELTEMAGHVQTGKDTSAAAHILLLIEKLETGKIEAPKPVHVPPPEPPKPVVEILKVISPESVREPVVPPPPVEVAPSPPPPVEELPKQMEEKPLVIKRRGRPPKARPEETSFDASERGPSTFPSPSDDDDDES